ncbi:MAG: DUF1566 domain-containing protein [Acidobacteriota bacterium]
MGAIFVSYRRGDSEGQARALSIALREHIGKDSVFMDVDSIALGRDFRQVLQERLGSCDLMLALIGPNWLDIKDAAGNRRLEGPTDIVRQEIAAALKRNIPVTPVLVQGTQMPAPEHLPEDIRDLAFRNGFELSHTRWESDVRELVQRLGLQAEGRQEPPLVVTAPVSLANSKDVMPGQGASRQRLWIPGLALLIFLMAGFIWLKYSGTTPNSQLPAITTTTRADKPLTVNGETPTGAQPPATSDGIVVDGELTWTKTDNGKDIDWNGANQYCNDLTLDGLSRWRLPNIDELAKLYDPKGSSDFKIRKPFRLTEKWVWSSTKQSSGSAFQFYFHLGHGYENPLRTSHLIRVMCVRGSGE